MENKSFDDLSVKALKRMLSLYRREHSIVGYSKMRRHVLITEIEKVFIIGNNKLYRRADIAVRAVPNPVDAPAVKEKKRIQPQIVAAASPSTIHPAFRNPTTKLTKGQERVQNVVSHLGNYYKDQPEDEEPSLSFKMNKGKGILRNAYNKVKKATHKILDVAQKVIHGRKTLSPRVESILKKVGDATITGIKIGRTSVPSLLNGIIKAVSSTPYDNLFHLFLILSTSKGNVLLEKNEVINMTLQPHIQADYKDISQIPSGVTVEHFLLNAQKRMGEHKFISYSAYDNNCQDFIKNVLQSNGINEGLDFVKQDTEDIFRNSPNLRKLANTVTDIAGRADVVLQGGQIRG